MLSDVSSLRDMSYLIDFEVMFEDGYNATVRLELSRDVCRLELILEGPEAKLPQAVALFRFVDRLASCEHRVQFVLDRDGFMLVDKKIVHAQECVEEMWLFYHQHIGV